MSEHGQSPGFDDQKPGRVDPEQVERLVREKLARAMPIDMPAAKRPVDLPFLRFFYRHGRDFK